MDKLKEAEDIIKALNLFAHPEGGYFGEIYKSEEYVSADALPHRYDSGRSFMTSIYFLLKGDHVSAFHRLKSDEVWYFHSGGSLITHQITPVGVYKKEILGTNVSVGEKPQVIFYKNSWFGAELLDKESYALIGCAVAPGFEFADFELGKRENLISKYPHLEDLIVRLT